MRPEIRRLTPEQFLSLLTAVPTLARKITSVHLHHTWRPNRAQFRGRASIEGMRNYHIGLGWSDIAQDTTVLLDREATRQRVLDALHDLIDSARAGDSLVFQYAGHGTQAEDLNGDEADRYDEALVPIDYTSGALLLDDDLAEVYRRLPEGAVLTLFTDCCHSGTNSRFAPIDRTPPRSDERRRFLQLTPEPEPPIAIRATPLPRHVREKRRVERRVIWLDSSSTSSSAPSITARRSTSPSVSSCAFWLPPTG